MTCVVIAVGGGSDGGVVVVEIVANTAIKDIRLLVSHRLRCTETCWKPVDSKILYSNVLKHMAGSPLSIE